MSEQRQTLIEFPCEIPIKVFGYNQVGLDALVFSLVRRHAPCIAESAVTCRFSAGGKYIAVTVTLSAQSQAQLDAIYLELTACQEIIMAL